ncbi:MAG: glycosyltransferase family 2 protein [Clostridia bacterium]|nr:glycosyltransferase family 2 protein [Clostridia bacterium]
MPFVSIIMPAYNAERTVKESVLSALKQTYSDFELIVIDDGSKDRTPEILRELAQSDARIRVLRNDPNVGVSRSRNRGIAEATGEWVAFLDSDDLWREDKLEKQLKLIEQYPDAALTYTASAFILNDGSPMGYVLPAKERIGRRELLRHNLLSCSSVMARTDLLRECPFPGDRIHEDYFVWLTLLKKIPYAYGVNEPLLIYRLTENSRSGNAWRSTKMLFRTYRAVGMNPISAALHVPPYLLYVINKKRKQKASR